MSTSTRNTRSRGPRFLTCHICGEKFGKSSLPIHQKRCEELFLKREARKPASKRRALPQAPAHIDAGAKLTGADIDAFNSAADEAFNTATLQPCQNCSRTFRPEALEIHMRSCKKLNKTAPVGALPRRMRRKAPYSPPQSPASRPSAHSSSSPAARRRFASQTDSEHKHGTRTTVTGPGPGGDRVSPSTPTSNRSVRKSRGAPKNRMAQTMPVKSLRRPRTIMCWLCGREFGSSSLLIHEKRCKALFKQQQKAQPRELRRRMPRLPDDFPEPPVNSKSMAEIQEYNDRAFEFYNSTSLVPCRICTRTFKPESLEVHLRSCAAAHPPEDLFASKIKQQDATRPKFIMCYLCGREFGQASFNIHQQRCKDLYLEKEQQKLRRERRPLPRLPADFPEPPLGSQDINEIQAYNDVAFEFYNSNSLVPCRNCGRTFKEESLEVHLRSCISEEPSSNEIYEAELKRQDARPHFVTCHICGTQHGQSSIEFHIPRCEEIWTQRESRKPRREQRPIPDPPAILLEQDLSNLDEYNDAAFHVFNDASLVQCYNCGRTFNDDALDIHLRSCVKDDDIHIFSTNL
jgi:zinc-finger of a C2HC-type